MHPFSGWEFRSWPLSRFRSLAERMLGQFPSGVVFLCSDLEASRLKPLRDAFRGAERMVFAPSSDILDSAAVIQQADLFVGNDSGPLHLAALLGVPVVGLFGPALPGQTAPCAARGVFIYEKISCSPCTQTRCIIPASSCMSRITVEEVFDAANRLLGEARAYKVASDG
jgi:ADP-heptose:LPS heptosyltransferase